MLTPRIPTLVCTETQNSFNSTVSIENYEKKATLCPCCALAEVHELTPLFYGEEPNTIAGTKYSQSLHCNYEDNDGSLETITETDENGEEKGCGEISFVRRMLQTIFPSSTSEGKRTVEDKTQPIE